MRTGANRVITLTFSLPNIACGILAPVTFGTSVKQSRSIKILLLVGFCTGSDESENASSISCTVSKITAN